MDRQLIIKQVEHFHSQQGLQCAKEIILAKIKNQRGLLNRFTVGGNDAAFKSFEDELSTTQHLSHRIILLAEARAAAVYWRAVRALVTEHASFTHRSADEPFTRLLNIGYHLLNKRTERIIVDSGLWPEVGVLHVSRHGKKPLVYDLMELFRQPVVDFILIKFIRAKKIRLTLVDEYDLKLFLSRVKLSFAVVEPMLKQQVDDLVMWVKTGKLPKIKRYKWRK